MKMLLFQNIFLYMKHYDAFFIDLKLDKADNLKEKGQNAHCSKLIFISLVVGKKKKSNENGVSFDINLRLLIIMSRDILSSMKGNMFYFTLLMFPR